MLPGFKGQALFQPIPLDVVQQLRGQTVTLGAWVWSDKPVQASIIELWVDGIKTSQVFAIDREPTFWSLRAEISPDAKFIQVNILPDLDDGNEPMNIYVDGLVLLEGNWPITETPILDNDAAKTGVWNGRRFNNLASNPSFETTWLTIKPKVETLIRESTRISLDYFLSSIQDSKASQRIHKPVIINIFKSFWARFGWNHIRLTSGWYWGLAILSIAGVGGMLYLLISNFMSGNYLSSRQLLSAGWLLAATLFVWIGAFIRTGFPYWGNHLFFPGARYAYPAIIPTILFLTVGWYWLSVKFTRKWIGIILVIVCFIFLDIISLVTIINFYQGS
jgi:hypothetical protein